MASTINIDFSISGNFSSTMDGMIEATGKLVGQLDIVKGKWEVFSDYVVGFNNLSDVAIKLADSFADVSRSGISLDKAMHELEAISGVTGDKLKEIEGYARQISLIECTPLSRNES